MGADDNDPQAFPSRRLEGRIRGSPVMSCILMRRCIYIAACIKMYRKWIKLYFMCHDGSWARV